MRSRAAFVAPSGRDEAALFATTVAWQASAMDEHTLAENIELQTSHTGMALHPAVRYAIGDRLAQPEGQRSFRRDGLLEWLYGDTQRLHESAAAV